MKRSLFFVGMGAMALATPLFLSSCSSSDDAASETPTPYTGEAVKTSFTLSVGLPKGNGSNGAKAFTGTRMTDAVAQAQSTPVFRGMDNMTLIPFVVSSENKVASGAARLGTSNVNLPNAVQNSLTNDQLTTTGNAKVYTDVTIPLTTNAFLFYGKAIDKSAGQPISDVSDKFTYGQLTADGLTVGAPDGIHSLRQQSLLLQ